MQWINWLCTIHNEKFNDSTYKSKIWIYNMTGPEVCVCVCVWLARCINIKLWKRFSSIWTLVIRKLRDHCTTIEIWKYLVLVSRIKLNCFGSQKVKNFISSTKNPLQYCGKRIKQTYSITRNKRIIRFDTSSTHCSVYLEQCISAQWYFISNVYKNKFENLSVSRASLYSLNLP